MSYERLVGLAAAGQFTLPAELLDAVANRAKLVKAASDLRRSFPEYDGSTQAMLNAEEVIRADVRADNADNVVRNYFKSNPSVIVADYLRPAFDALIAETRKTCPANSPTTADAAVRVADGSRDYLNLEALAERYKAIIEAAQVIYGAGGRDNHKMFAETKAGPDRTSAQFRYSEPRGPKDPLARLLWLAHAPDAQPYLPTNAERDAALDGFQSGTVSAAHNAAVNNTNT
jgi:hypothetical protein